jgi:hypothetical protein
LPTFIIVLQLNKITPICQAIFPKNRLNKQQIKNAQFLKKLSKFKARKLMRADVGN